MAQRPHTIIISGGVSHNYEDSTRALAAILEAAGFDCAVTEDPDIAWEQVAAGNVDLLTVNTLRWRMAGERYAAQAPRWAYHVAAPARDALAAHLGAGRGMLAMHAASICFDDWPEWGADYLGGAWVWDESRHDPPGPAHVRIAGKHDVLGDAKDFDVVDEIYTKLAIQPDVHPLAFATIGNGTEAHPVLWTRDIGPGRVVYDALGHDRRSLEQPDHRAIIMRAARWAAGASVEQQGGIGHA